MVTTCDRLDVSTGLATRWPPEAERSEVDLLGRIQGQGLLDHRASDTAGGGVTPRGLREAVQVDPVQVAQVDGMLLVPSEGTLDLQEPLRAQLSDGTSPGVFRQAVGVMTL